MDESGTKLRLSDEAISLFFLQGGFASACVDLRPLLALQCEHGPAVKRAAERWGVTPDQVIVFHGKQNNQDASQSETNFVIDQG